MNFPTHSLLRLMFCVWLLSVLAPTGRAQQSQVPHTAATSTQGINYPDTTKGLEQLGRDLISGVKNKDTKSVTAIVLSMMLPDPAAFYHHTFGDFSGTKEIASYQQDRAKLPLSIVALFKRAIDEKATTVEAKRFELDCDDNDGEDTFPVLDARVNKTPLYDLRLFTGAKYLRLWPMAYVDGAFRYVGEPHPWEYFAPLAGTAAPSPTQSAAPPPEANTQQKGATGQSISRVRQGGTVVAAKIVKQVVPYYPDLARRERVQGTVRLHAVIAKDGKISQLNVIRGFCSLSASSLEAVRQWRYTPTLLLGQPVEVDTTIDVIFQLKP
jgi:TonB family protein